ncbi:MAG: leucyl aminopeptidase [Bacteroidetes bacterium]|nr:MAG: leucyl aminopeptidase [Bacteroidota bacterium]
MTTIQKASSLQDDHLVILCSSVSALSRYGLGHAEIDHVRNNFEKTDRKLVLFTGTGRHVYVLKKDKKDNPWKTVELIRKAGASTCTMLNEHKIKAVTIADTDDRSEHLLALAEGIALANYQFLKYKKNPDKEKNSLVSVSIFSKSVKPSALSELTILSEATTLARTLVNEPVSWLSAQQLSKEFEKLGKDAGFRVEIFNKAKIESLKMGGLLAVNKGSKQPPTFTIMEYKHARARNKKPIVLVGKGVVYDTGGYNLKTGTGMETMKCDMAGAAAVGCTLYAIAKAKLPVHVIGLVPATDNRIDGDAYVAGDVLTMYDGTTVEMLNTDAEGRLILADALSWGEQYKPELVIDLATLTGAAVAAIGQHGIVSMGTAGDRVKNKLKTSGNATYERLAEMPFWEEYDEMIKSDIAEIKNIGGPYGGSITAGKFLAWFVKSPWMHFDIAGPAFLPARDGYRTKGGTGVGVRLLFDFLKNYSN